MSKEPRLDDRPLTQPAAQRLPPDHPARAAILAAHARAMKDGRSMYADPETGLSVLTARYLAERGHCCGTGCRHCPYVRDIASDAGDHPPAGGVH